MHRVLSVAMLAVLPSVAAAQIATAVPARTKVPTTPGLLQIKTQEDARDFWGADSARVLTSGTLLLEDKVFGANLEILTDIIGWFRVGLGITAAGSNVASDSTGNPSAAADEGQAQEAISRLANTGGTVRLTASYPIWFRAAQQYNSTWALIFSVGGGTETPKAGGFLENPALTGQAGLELFYQRAGLERMIDFQFGVTARGYAFNDAYATKASVDANNGLLIVPRLGIVLLGKTRIDLLLRWVRSDAFDNLGKVAVTLQQVTR